MMNVKKTKYVIFGLKSQTKKIGDHHMTVNATKLDKVNSYTYLGITLDSNLTFNKHIENCKKFATHKVFLLYKIRKYIDMETSLKIFKSMVIPYIEYGDIIYSGSNSRMLNCRIYKTAACVFVSMKQGYQPFPCTRDVSWLL